MKKLIMAGISTITAFTCMAQTDSSKKSTTHLVYSVDAYYRYDFNDAPAGTNNLTSFTNSKNSFELGMASVKAEHTYGKIAATADLGFGRRAQEFSYNDVNTLVAVKQLFISYAPSSAVKFTIGKWATHIGYEMVDAYLNRNYSMSYGFSYGPFFHTGLKADISLGGKSAFMIGVANPTDFSTTTSATKVLIAQFSTGTNNDKLRAYLNFQGGTGFSQFDLVLNGSIANQFSISYDGTLKSVKTGTVRNSWSSNALYFNYDPSAKFGLTLRSEYFADGRNVAGVGTSVFQTTLSGNIHLDNLTIIPEIRVDNAGNTIFSKSSGTATKNDAGFILAAVYKF
ncbi:MAG: outer membrane beta-barrel protein [Sediminibacterium sp.]